MARVRYDFRCPVCGEELSDWAVKHGYGAWALTRTRNGVQTKSYIHTKCYESIKHGSTLKGGDKDGA